MTRTRTGKALENIYVRKGEEVMSSKEAAFMLDTDMEQDMRSYAKEVTLGVIKAINKSSELYKDVKFGVMGAREHNAKHVEAIIKKYAKAHDNEIGGFFITELEVVDWQEIMDRV